jgi:hypothetical protein
MSIVTPNPNAVEINLANTGEIFLYVNPVYRDNCELDVWSTKATCRFAKVTTEDKVNFYPDILEVQEIEDLYMPVDSNGFVLFVPCNFIDQDQSLLPYEYSSLANWVSKIRSIIGISEFSDEFLVDFWDFYGTTIKLPCRPKYKHDLFPGLIFNHKEAFLAQIKQALDENLGAILQGKVKKDNKLSKRGLVYFIQNTHTLEVKIGRSTVNSLQDRLDTLQVANAHELRIIKTISSTNCHSLEFQMHRRFQDYHIRGEWFCYEGDLIDFIKT